MVETLGSEALKDYCHNGCLDTDCIKRVEESRFTQPDSEEEPGDESGGDDAEPAGDAESEDEDGDDAQPASDEESD